MLPIFFSLILAGIHLWNEKIQIKQEYVRSRIISFVAGISVTYVFLSLLPEVYQGFELFDKIIFISLLFGFVTAHLVEKYFYQHSAPKALLQKLSLIHSGAFFLYHLMLGVILVKLNQVSTIESVLFFLPVLFYSAVGLIALERIHSKIWENWPLKILLSSSTLIGVLIADLLLNFSGLFNLLFGFVVGIFLYFAIIDFVPKESKGKPEYFALGVLIYTLLIVSTYI